MRKDQAGAFALAGIVAAGAAASAAFHVGLAVSGVDGASWNPAALILQLASGQTRMPARGWAATAAAMAGIVLPLAAAALWQIRRRARRARGDSKARLTGGKKASLSVRARAVADKARAFGLDPAKHPGYPLGRAVAGGEKLYGDWESVGTIIAGPRTGKTVGFAVPFVLSGPGAVLATSNKRDLVDATRLVRERATGEPAWVFDPCGITKRPPEFYWNPLTYLTSDGFNGSIVARARTLSRILGDAARATGGKAAASSYHPFWDGGGDMVRSHLLAAAALDGKSMADVHRWAAKETDVDPVDILRAHGLASSASELQGALDLPADTKGGVWASARMGLGWVADPAIQAWWTPGKTRQAFDPAVFVQSRQTLYSLSADSTEATPLVSALTAVTCLAAEYCAEANGGRLAVPMMVVLDEAANVCPWQELPKLYSHLGSRGICPQTILQSWSQGIDVWGETGMSKLFSASNTTVYAGGVKETDQLEKISKLIGVQRPDQVSTSISHGARSTSVTTEGQERPIASVDELASLPKGRAWLIATQSRPVLIEIIPWFATDQRAAVEESIAVYSK